MKASRPAPKKKTGDQLPTALIREIDKIVEKWKTFDWQNHAGLHGKDNAQRRSLTLRRAKSVREAMAVMDRLLSDGLHLSPRSTVMYEPPASRVAEGVVGENVLSTLRAELAYVARALDHESLLLSPSRHRPKAFGPRLLAAAVARACKAHGIQFTDAGNGMAAHILADVFRRVNLGTMSASALRPYLRFGRRHQDQQPTGGWYFISV